MNGMENCRTSSYRMGETRTRKVQPTGQKIQCFTNIFPKMYTVIQTMNHTKPQSVNNQELYRTNDTYQTMNHTTSGMLGVEFYEDYDPSAKRFVEVRDKG